MSDLSTPKKSFRHLDIVMSAFVAVLVISNIASSAKIIDFGFSLFGVPMAFDAGTLLFPLSYIFGDILTEVYGFKTSRRVIWTGFAILALMTGFFWLVSVLPGEAYWQEYAGQNAYSAILGGVSTGGIAVASLAGYLFGEFSNSVVLAKIKVAMKGKKLFVRTIGSTLVGQAFDTVIFVLVASAFGVFCWELFLTLVLTNYIFKCSVEALMTPFTYLACNKLKKAEGIDVYDTGSLNPFQG